jgi:catecholate siderophore receptor
VVVHRSTFFGDPSANDSRAEVNLGSAAIEHQRGIWNFRNTVLAGDYGKFYQNVVPGAVNAAGTLVTFSGYNDENARRNLFNQTDVTATHYTGAIRHVLLMGTEFGRQRAWNLRNTALFPNGSSTIQVPLLSPNVNLHASFAQRTVDNRPAARVAAAFVQDQIELSRYVQLVAGIRYDNFASEVADRRSAATFQRTDNLISPRLGLVLKPAAEISLYGSYSVSYLPSSGDQFSSLNPTTQALKPEKFNNYEGGLKWDINRNLSLTSALYRLDRLNTTAPDPNIAGRLVQTGSQRTNGFETSLSGMVTDRWTIAGGYSWQDAFISSRTTAALPGKKVAIVPRHNLSLWNSVRLLTRLSAGLGLIRQGEMFAGIDNAVTLPAFTRVDAALFYNLTERVRLQANAENLTNRNYYPTAHNNSNIMPGSPLAIRVGLVVGF